MHEPTFFVFQRVPEFFCQISESFESLGKETNKELKKNAEAYLWRAEFERVCAPL